MKRNISDLLDSYPVEGLDLGSTTPYSSSRIKELTMSKVSTNKPRKHLRPLRFLAVAAISSALTVSAMRERSSKISSPKGVALFRMDRFRLLIRWERHLKAV